MVSWLYLEDDTFQKEPLHGFLIAKLQSSYLAFSCMLNVRNECLLVRSADLSTSVRTVRNGIALVKSVSKIY